MNQMNKKEEETKKKLCVCAAWDLLTKRKKHTFSNEKTKKIHISIDDGSCARYKTTTTTSQIKLYFHVGALLL